MDGSEREKVGYCGDCENGSKVRKRASAAHRSAAVEAARHREASQGHTGEVDEEQSRDRHGAIAEIEFRHSAPEQLIAQRERPGQKGEQRIDEQSLTARSGCGGIPSGFRARFGVAASAETVRQSDRGQAYKVADRQREERRARDSELPDEQEATRQRAQGPADDVESVDDRHLSAGQRHVSDGVHHHGKRCAHEHGGEADQHEGGEHLERQIRRSAGQRNPARQHRVTVKHEQGEKRA